MSPPKAKGTAPRKPKGEDAPKPAKRAKAKVTREGDFVVIDADGLSPEEAVEAIKGAKKRRAPDWETIEGQYRANVLSLRVIGAQHGISEGAIRKRAKAEVWQRDLADKVRKQAKEELVRSDGYADSTQRTVKEVERQAVQTIVSVVRNHRSILKRGYDVLEGLLAELQETADNRDEIEAAIEQETATDKDTKRKAMMQRAIALPSRAGVMLNLSAAMKNVIGLERQAFNIDDAVPPNESTIPAITKDMSARDAAEIYQRSLEQGH